MKIKNTLIAMAFFLSLLGLKAQTSCIDLNGYVSSKNQGLTGYYTLIKGYEEFAAQTYHYSGPGKIGQIRVYGQYPGAKGGVVLRISIYNVDANGRPTSALRSVDKAFMTKDNLAGFITATFGDGGVSVTNNFAVVIELRTTFFPFGDSFQLKYTGDGEGRLEDLSSLAGTSTGFNWTSAKDTFAKEGDFYMVPQLTNFITSNFNANSQCVTASSTLTFTNTSLMNKDSMFNIIGMANYSGTNHYYSWNFGDGSPVSYLQNPTHSYSTPGVYTVSLTSTLEGWTSACTDVHTMAISVGLGVSATSIVNVTCNGGNDGSITAVAIGGAPPFLYSLEDFNFQASPVMSGLPIDNYTLHIKDALGCTKTTPVTISEPPAILFLTSSTTNASCGNNDGSILVVASGGTGTLQYKLNSGSYQSSGAFSNVTSGSHVVTIKDINGCTNFTTLNVNDQGAPVLSVLSTTNASCNGTNDGSVILLATGGSGALQYSVNGGQIYQTSGTFPALIAGNYSLLVKDAAGCKNGRRLTISQPPMIELQATANAVNCNGGKSGVIDVASVTGGIGTFTYSLNGINYQSDPHFDGLLAGTYTVYAKDVASCVNTTTIDVTQPAAVSATVTLNHETCNLSNDGSIAIVATGGSGKYKYSINDFEFQPTGTFNNLDAGTYKISVEDALACPYVTYVTLNQPSAISVTAVTGNSTCGNSNGNILVSSTGGSGSGYQYSLDGQTYNSTGSFTGKSAGTYYIYLMDGTGCQSIASATINDSNGPVLTSTSHTNVACNSVNDGSITVNAVTGGTGTLEYSLNGENWSTSSSFNSLYAGTYTVTVRDANGCTGTEVITLTEPNAFAINTAVSNVQCNGSAGGAVTISAAGGSGTMAYSINGGFTFQSSPNFTNLNAGIYNVIVRDAASCMGSKVFSIMEPLSLNIFAGVLHVSCSGANDGGFSIIADGGTGAYQYSIDGSSYQTSNLFMGLNGGIYTAYVKDANNCVKTKTITIIEPASVTINSNVSDVACNGGNNGVIDLSVTGGVSGYSYEWSSGNVTEDVFNLSAGVYSVIVIDANGCAKTSSYTITEPSLPLIINGVITPATSPTATDGALDITVGGGTPPYSYTWSNSATTADLSNLAVGTYTITLTDGNGCSTANVFTVNSSLGIYNFSNQSEQILIFPNPANEKVMIESNGLIIQKLKVMNVLGQNVFEAEPQNSKFELNTTAFEQGAYFVQIYTENTIVTKKLKIIK